MTASAMRVHPRGRGEAAASVVWRLRRAGPSPRARGSPGIGFGNRRHGGSIPAGAGKPPRPLALLTRAKVHPRGRGEATGLPQVQPARTGPSPRARGSRADVRRRRARRRSIPAGAGKPHGNHRRLRRVEVHPRGRGEAARSGPATRAASGPSPRARGSRRGQVQRPPGGGSIPAGAGKPPPAAPSRPGARVHPRGRGEAPFSRYPAQSEPGPSPRARGSHVVSCVRPAPHGSIPAGAGKPTATRGDDIGSRVHPRGRGEANA